MTDKLTTMMQQVYPRLRVVREIFVLDMNPSVSVPLSTDPSGDGTAYMIYGLLKYLHNQEIQFCLAIAHAKMRYPGPPLPDWFVEAMHMDYPTQLEEHVVCMDA
ncbi:MAG: hypothetical protein H6716_20730 [Polyangiaceae bacterium]|nr:hypothetical protein [Polyangiaceae bacterium]